VLLSMDVSNFALIGELNAEFVPGFNVLTGETGAGKSIIIGALMLLLGERASLDQIRTGEEFATVSGLFEVDDDVKLRQILEENGIPRNDDNTLVVFREVSRNGKNRCRINHKLCTLSLLKQVGECLVDIHGQYQHQSLLNKETHIDFVDEFGGKPLLEQRNVVAGLYDECYGKKAELRKYSGDIHERTRQIDLLRFQIEDIESTRLEPGEDERLYRERKVLSNIETIQESIEKCHVLLEGMMMEQPGVEQLLGEVLDLLGRVSELDPALQSVFENIQSAFYMLEEVSQSLRRYKDNLDIDVERIDFVEQRIADITALKRKYGDTIDDIFKYLENAKKELDRLENCAQAAEKLENEIREMEQELENAAVVLSGMRQKVIPVLEDRITKELISLNMPNIVFKVQLEHVNVPSSQETSRARRNGIDEVEFLISPNLGEELKSLVRIASGGEISRIMLAFKTVLAVADKVETLVFDEIDVGIGGRTADIVAGKLASIAQSKQVICITHLPQIAAYADLHYHISKSTVGNRTFSTIKRLTEDERLLELAKMLGGSENIDIAIQHARELVNLAKSKKLA
jgi:DNA repair protein RecN (Recombination protein N)